MPTSGAGAALTTMRLEPGTNALMVQLAPVASVRTAIRPLWSVTVGRGAATVTSEVAVRSSAVIVVVPVLDTSGYLDDGVGTNVQLLLDNALGGPAR
ncbi:hypothetical protein [Labedaea rhizosphaerae]|nr:hypothetical protein [Labedaea rhizosphaerae]